MYFWTGERIVRGWFPTFDFKDCRMRLPSRNMPKRIVHKAARFGVLLIAGLLAFPGLIWWPLALALPALVLAATIADRQRCRNIAKARAGESICQFARSFDRKTVDPWVIRAVYEELSNEFPIRRSDSFYPDLRIDADDQDDYFEVIALRLGRSLENSKDNPWFGKVETVGDFVFALQCQPKL
jgi:hypothetical protein